MLLLGNSNMSKASVISESKFALCRFVLTTIFNQIKGRDENGDGNITRSVQDCLD